MSSCNPILLFGGGLQVLAVARDLRQIDYQVDVVGADITISRFSRYVRTCVKIDMDHLSIDAFVEIVREGGYRVIIPMEDEYAQWLSHNIKNIESLTSAKCAVMDVETYTLASDKGQLLAFCSQHSIPHPRTAPITSNYREIVSYVGFPALIKPVHSAGSRGIKRVDNLAELQVEAPKIIAEFGACSLQEYIENDHYYNVMLYRKHDGTWGNHTITRISRCYPIKGGSSSFCETIEQTELLEICKRLLDELRWVGFADFDVLEKTPGDYRIIEINPRIPASVRAASISGVNFGAMIVADLMGKPLPQYSYTVGRQLRCLGLDLAWFVSSPQRFQVTPSWFKFLDKNLYYQEGGIHDVLAMLASLCVGVKKFLSPSFRKKKMGMNC